LNKKENASNASDFQSNQDRSERRRYGGSIEGEISLVNGDGIPFIARRSKTSSTAC
jgi:hypothetical protein